MLALDTNVRVTNVLVRNLAQDDARQTALATRLLEQRVSAHERGYVSLAALLELGMERLR